MSEERASAGARLVIGIIATLVLGVLGALGWLWWLWAETPEEVRATISPAKRRVVVAIASFSIAAPVLGLLMTVRGLTHSFDAVSGEGVDASQKQRLLSEGISFAMTWTAVGLGLMIVGTVALLVVGFRLARATDQHTPH